MNAWDLGPETPHCVHPEGGVDWAECQYRYRVCQTTIAGNVDGIGGLAVTPVTGVDVYFLVEHHEPLDTAGVQPAWFHHYRSRRTGEPVVSCARLPGGYFLRSHGEGDFVVSADGRFVSCRPASPNHRQGVFESFVDTILPLVLTLRGRDGMHAAAVEIDGVAVVFTGVSKLGKSTLAAYLAYRGCRTLTDEYLGLRKTQSGIMASRGAPWMRLWSDSAAALQEMGDKGWQQHPNAQKMVKWLDPAMFDRGPVPVSRVYRLDGDQQPGTHGTRVHEMPRADALMTLLGQTYRLELSDQAMLERQTDLLASLVADGTVRRLSVSRGYDALPLAFAEIQRDLAA